MTGSDESISVRVRVMVRAMVRDRVRVREGGLTSKEIDHRMSWQKPI